ncbi:tRNA (adenosine(37)-N6)-threonylcarbamoyltransferase complex dimerization subunit type 1 TsaB [Segniliparus rugosus]|uniref:Universal bacterial protein YeaZ n=1 Tax=Segniliparus rugosus (strain ATCC BAA-974 / DSM 45345 / CCUG 50838 / CIP 108380 / JCM 13579 / CDC 945) TaxID=679197 RepID=E5XQM3_SEGRC|nr:tRNA (adenosine(37)-N6)-threonylcarbamoyltransferase complex dimerization subunit type 1 TsaB [Segniliparus rugosus]EFV13336.1 universal bacterial protein YeaZ [Segniliparus rugosus ATCC BAA-974]
MLVLTIDTSTADSAVGLVRWSREDESWLLLGEERSLGNVHVEQLAPMIERALGEGRKDELEAVVVGLGPGPYTGLRIGIATAAAYGDALGLPVYGVCGLDAIADEALGSEPETKNLLVVTDAKRREVFWARYRDGQRTEGPGVCKPSELPELLGGFVPEAVAGAAYLLDGGALQDVRKSCVVAPAAAGLARSASRAMLAGEAPAPLAALYLRPPDAVPPASMKGVLS